MSQKQRMICPKCSTQMNHHANKPDRSTALTELDIVDPELEGILEVHTCPDCKNVEVQRTS